MTIAAWPLATRSEVVDAYGPASAKADEGLFRTMRDHAWATAGVRVDLRLGHRLAGRETVFSSLNVHAARFARHGDHDAAVRTAQVAAEVESSEAFDDLRSLLAKLPAAVVHDVVAGRLAPEASAELRAAVLSVARTAERLRTQASIADGSADVQAGRVVEVHEGWVVIHSQDHPATTVPRWMAAEVRREQIGDCLVIIADRVGRGRAICIATPAIDLAGEPPLAAPQHYSPFGRRIHAISDADARTLSGRPEPLRVLVPVTVQG